MAACRTNRSAQADEARLKSWRWTSSTPSHASLHSPADDALKECRSPLTEGSSRCARCKHFRSCELGFPLAARPSSPSRQSPVRLDISCCKEASSSRLVCICWPGWSFLACNPVHRLPPTCMSSVLLSKLALPSIRLSNKPRRSVRTLSAGTKGTKVPYLSRPFVRLLDSISLACFTLLFLACLVSAIAPRLFSLNSHLHPHIGPALSLL